MMTRRQAGDMPLSKPMLIQFLDIYVDAVTQPQPAQVSL